MSDMRNSYPRWHCCFPPWINFNGISFLEIRRLFIMCKYWSQPTTNRRVKVDIRAYVISFSSSLVEPHWSLRGDFDFFSLPVESFIAWEKKKRSEESIYVLCICKYGLWENSYIHDGKLDTGQTTTSKNSVRFFCFSSTTATHVSHNYRRKAAVLSSSSLVSVDQHNGSGI